MRKHDIDIVGEWSSETGIQSNMDAHTETPQVQGTDVRDTRIWWVHSHVQRSPSTDCDPKRWARTGNERADALAKEGAGEPQLGTR